MQVNKVRVKARERKSILVKEGHQPLAQDDILELVFITKHPRVCVVTSVHGYKYTHRLVARYRPVACAGQVASKTYKYKYPSRCYPLRYEPFTLLVVPCSNNNPRGCLRFPPNNNVQLWQFIKALREAPFPKDVAAPMLVHMVSWCCLVSWQ
jgi:hypothetical protein